MLAKPPTLAAVMGGIVVVLTHLLLWSMTRNNRAVLRSSIREFLCSEYMHAIGVPTTRVLSLIGILFLFCFLNLYLFVFLFVCEILEYFMIIYLFLFCVFTFI